MAFQASVSKTILKLENSGVFIEWKKHRVIAIPPVFGCITLRNPNPLLLFFLRAVLCTLVAPDSCSGVSRVEREERATGDEREARGTRSLPPLRAHCFFSRETSVYEAVAALFNKWTPGAGHTNSSSPISAVLPGFPNKLFLAYPFIYSWQNAASRPKHNARPGLQFGHFVTE